MSSQQDWELDWLVSLVAFADGANIVHAAKSRGISQPALSVHLRKLEDRSLLPLFSHQGKRKVLTRYGEAIVAEVRKSLGALEDRIRFTNQRFLDPVQSEWKIAARREILPKVSSLLMPEGKTTYIAMGHDEGVRALLERKVDVAVTHLRPNLANLHSRKLFENHVDFVFHESLIERSKRTLEHLSNPSILSKLPVLLYKSDPPFFREWCQHARLGLNQLKIRSICEDWHAIAALVSDKHGVSIIPGDIEITDKAVVRIAIPPKIVPSVSFYAIYYPEIKNQPFLRPKK